MANVNFILYSIISHSKNKIPVFGGLGTAVFVEETLLVPASKATQRAVILCRDSKTVQKFKIHVRTM